MSESSFIAGAIIFVGLLFTAGTLGLALFTYKSNSARDAILLGQQAQQLLSKANQETVEMLERRVSNLEGENLQLRQEMAECQRHKNELSSQYNEMLKTNYALQSRILGLADDVDKNAKNRRRNQLSRRGGSGGGGSSGNNPPPSSDPRRLRDDIFHAEPITDDDEYSS